MELRRLSAGQARECRQRYIGVGAVVGIAVFDAGQQVLRHRIVDADAGGPADADVPGRFRDRREHFGVGVRDIGIGQAAGRIEQGAVGGEAEAAAQAALPLDPGVARTGRVVEAALVAGGLDVGLEAEHGGADLIVGAGEEAADDAVGVVAPLEAGEGASAGERLISMVAAPGVSDLAAQVEAGPRIDRRHHGRGRLVERQVGGIGRLRQATQ